MGGQTGFPSPRLKGTQAFAEPKPAAKNPTRLMIPSRRREHIEAGVARFLSVVPH